MSKTIAAGGSSVDGCIGDIITSMLDEATFQSQRNSGWVLMDGRSVAGSRYASITGQTNIPDARGQFLRGKNNGRADGHQNPDGDLALGTRTGDKLESHAHDITYGNTAGAFLQWNGGVAGFSKGGSRTDTAIQATANGSNETAPKNITINYFIKIN